MVSRPIPPEGAGQGGRRRWITLAIVITSIFIVILDNSVLNVAIPTILRDFHTTLPSLQWVVTGYALTFASLLIVGGRFGDVYGHRNVFIVGALLFGSGSLLASLSWNVPSLVVGEALIEGVGASMMMPATLAILSVTFSGRERATAFAAWGATAGAAASFGPLVGGFFTTDYSWRWSFRINVIIAPVAIAGALMFMPAGLRTLHRARIDLRGAVLIASGMFVLVFGLSEGGTYGWIRPIAPFSAFGLQVWSARAPVSMIPFCLLVALALLGGFYRLESALERRGADPLFEFGQLQHRAFRYGLLTTMLLAVGQLGLLFVLPVFLQDAKGLSALTNGVWMVPTGLFVVAGAQLAGRLSQRWGVTNLVRIGLVAETVGLVLVASALRTSVTFLGLLPGLLFYGLGIGSASAQLTNVVLSEVAPDKSGVASGANATVRQAGSALGVAVIGSILTTATVRHALAALSAARDLPRTVKISSTTRIRALGLNFSPPPGLPARESRALHNVMASATSAGTRPAVLFAAGMVGAGALLSFLIPAVELPDRANRPGPDDDVERLETSLALDLRP